MFNTADYHFPRFATPREVCYDSRPNLPAEPAHAR
jgi:hypothetical protein